jgi:hypothetical protein
VTNHLKNITTKATKRGRPLIGEKPLTDAERKRISRKNKAASGDFDVTVKLKERYLSAIKKLSETNHITRSEMIEALLNMTLWNVVDAFEVASKLKSEGKNDNEVAVHFHSLLNKGSSIEAMRNLKEMLKI